LTALFYLGKGGLTEHVSNKIASSLSVEEFSKLIACKMPRWMQSGMANLVGNRPLDKDSVRERLGSLVGAKD
jgi:hypothetical protein